jgi:Flp pilus assembly pilin Flp
MTFRHRLRALLHDDSGQDLLEYALLCSLIALIAYGAVQATGTVIVDFFTEIGDTFAGIV